MLKLLTAVIIVRRMIGVTARSSFLKDDPAICYHVAEQKNVTFIFPTLVELIYHLLT